MKISLFYIPHLLYLTSFIYFTSIVVVTESTYESFTQSELLHNSSLGNNTNSPSDSAHLESSQSGSLLDKLLLRSTAAPRMIQEKKFSVGAPTSDSSLAIQGNELGSGENDDDYNDEDKDDDDDDGDDDHDADEEDVDEDASKKDAFQAMNTEAPFKPDADDVKFVSDIFGNKMKLENNRTILVAQNKARDLGLLTLKAILLGPLIGLTIKAALIRGLFWAVGAYLLHLFFPGVLGALGLGTGLVGFARQLQPDYTQMLMPHLIDLQNSLPSPIRGLIGQYKQVFQPVVEAIRSIPDGHCRFRAVCETANYLVRNTRFISTSLQRLSATVYLNFGTEYSKAWLDGVVQSDCALKYAQCTSSPFSMIANRVGEALRSSRPPASATS